MLKVSEGVAAANFAAAESDPIFPQSYELTPHWSLIRGFGNILRGCSKYENNYTGLQSSQFLIKASPGVSLMHTWG